MSSSSELSPADPENNSSSSLPSSGSPSSGSFLGNASGRSFDTSAAPNVPSESGEKILIAYFSRWGNTNYPDDVDATTSASIVIDNDRFGTTEYVARMIQETVGGDLFSIQVNEPYSYDYDECLDRAAKEKSQKSRPALKNRVENFSEYDIVFLGYPNWWYTALIFQNPAIQ